MNTIFLSFRDLFLYFFSFFLLWYGSGLIISSIQRFSKKLRISTFSFSFFVLGLITSIPEFAVGLTAVAENKPHIFVGNLIGGIPVIFFLIIPILAIFGNGITLHNRLNKKDLIVSCLVMLSPLFFIYDKRITTLEGICMIILYVVLFLFIERKKGIFDTAHNNVLSIKKYSHKDLLKILFGIGIVFIASQLVIDKTLYFASVLQISPFYISLLFLSLGTNIPELSLAIRSIFSRTQDIALGDYIGSAAANTVLFGIFVLLSPGEIILSTNFISISVVILFGIMLFFYFTQSKNDISRKEGIILILIYIIFVSTQQLPLK